MFVKYENMILSPEFLYQEAWGQPMFENDNVLRIAMSELRKKLDGSGDVITTERGKGYRFEVE